jgi:hypothetical protein
MPRIRKSLPDNRADYSFGDFVYWHLFVFGTRPSIDPAAKVGRPWRLEDIGSRLGKTDKTLRNWVNDKSLPDEISELCKELFGDNKAWDGARLELHESLTKARKPRSDKTAPVAADEPALPLEEPAASDGVENGEAERDGPASPSEHVCGSDDDKEASDEALRRPPNAKGTRDIVRVEPVLLKRIDGDPYQKGRSSYRRAATSLVAGLCVFMGLSAWLTSGRQTRAPDPVTPKVAELPVLTKEADRPPPAPAIEVRPEPRPVEAAPPLPPPPLQQEATPKEERRAIEVPRPREATPEERRQAELERIERDHMEARRQAHDREVQAKEAEALRLDRERDRRQRDLDLRSADARTVAGLNYRIEEHRRVDGTSYTHILAASVADCANACTGDPSCDAFGFYREQFSLESKRKRYCYFFRKPFRVDRAPGYVHGEPIEPRRRADVIDATSEQGLLIRVQAQNSERGSDDGVTRCATGPVKASGFALTCDQILSGGTTLGSVQLSHTVANINECASKCRPVQRCVGFTFNAADMAGRHSCVIFGPTPEARESKGWVSGVR